MVRNGASNTIVNNAKENNGTVALDTHIDISGTLRLSETAISNAVAFILLTRYAYRSGSPAFTALDRNAIHLYEYVYVVTTCININL